MNTEIIEKALSHIEWEESGLNYGETKLEGVNTMFGKDIKITVLCKHDEPPRAPDTAAQNLSGFLSFTEKHLEKVKSLLWDNCLEACSLTNYGGFTDIPGMTAQESNLHNFGITNMEDAYNKCTLQSLVLDAAYEKYLPNRYYLIEYAVPWDNEHGCSILIKNDVVIACIHYGDSLKEFEDEVAYPS